MKKSVHSAVRMQYVLWSEKQQSIVATSEAVIVCVDKKTMQKTEIPEHIREKIKALELSVQHEI